MSKKCFNLSQELVETLSCRNPRSSVQSLSQALTYELESLFLILEHAMRKNRHIFTQNEIKLILDVFNTTEIQRGREGRFWLDSGLYDAIENACITEKKDQEWEVELHPLLSKVANLPDLQKYALVDWARIILDASGGREHDANKINFEIQKFQKG